MWVHPSAVPYRTWQDIRAMAHINCARCLFPDGSMEQTGRTASVGTDALVDKSSRDMPNSLAAVMTCSSVADLHVAAHEHHSLGLVFLHDHARPSTMIAAMADWTESLMRPRVRGASTGTMVMAGTFRHSRAAFSEIHCAVRSFDPRRRRHRPGLTLKRRDWWDFKTDGPLQQSSIQFRSWQPCRRLRKCP